MSEEGIYSRVLKRDLRQFSFPEEKSEGGMMEKYDTTYRKPTVTKNGNIKKITFNHAGWNCSLGDTSSDSSSDDGDFRDSTSDH